MKFYTELQVLPNNVERYAVKLIILSHIFTFMNKLMYNPPCYHKNIVFFLNYALNERFIITVSTFPACDESCGMLKKPDCDVTRIISRDRIKTKWRHPCIAEIAMFGMFNL